MNEVFEMVAEVLEELRSESGEREYSVCTKEAKNAAKELKKANQEYEKLLAEISGEQRELLEKYMDIVDHAHFQEEQRAYYQGMIDTIHVETVCLLSKLHEAKHHVNVRLDMDEMDLTAAESKATYEEIKKYVAEYNDGMKVSDLYIAQVKRKCGIKLAENFNIPRSEGAKQPQCPKEKEEAIIGALKAFQMI